MTNKIGGFENRPVLVSTDRKVRNQSDDTPAPSAGSAVASNAVRITDHARQLATLEQAIQSAPAIDEARVAEVRQALQEGRYEVRPERIADKLLRFEKELF